MIKRIKMIVLDLDGTLLNTQKEISSKTRNVLIEKKKHGKMIALASGRTLGSMQYALKDLSFADFLITNNGAALYHVSKGYFVFQDTFPIEMAVQIFDTYKEKCFSVNICSANYFYQYTNDRKIDRNTSIVRVKDFEGLKEKNVSVCHMDLNISKQELISDIVEEINDTFPLLEAFIMQDSFSDMQWIDIVKKGVSKSGTLTKLQDMVDINKEETVLFGDGLNDIEMLQKNGYGVAMGNALSEVKKVCKDVTDSHDEDGIVKWLDKNDI